MKKLLYPKTYSTIIDIIYNDSSSYVVRNSRVVFKPISPIFVFQTDDGREIRQQCPRTSGSTPHRLLDKWRLYNKNKMRRDHYLIGVRVKLYLRPQDNGRWSYRHMGE